MQLTPEKSCGQRSVARGGKGSVARAVVRSRATKTRVSKSSLQLSQHQLFTGPVRGWADEKLVLHKLHFHPDFVAPFSPPCEGGVGGVVPARPVTRSSHALSSQSFRIPLARREEPFSISKARASPPWPPLRKGEKDRSPGSSFDHAQQEHASRNRHCNSVNPNFSPAQCEAGLMKSWCCTSCTFIRISLRPFPPLAKGG